MAVDHTIMANYTHYAKVRQKCKVYTRDEKIKINSLHLYTVCILPQAYSYELMYMHLSHSMNTSVRLYDTTLKHVDVTHFCSELLGCS